MIKKKIRTTKTSDAPAANPASRILMSAAPNRQQRQSQSTENNRQTEKRISKIAETENLAQVF